MRLKYNSPVILTYTLLCVFVLGLRYFIGDSFVNHYFSAPSKFEMNFANPIFYFRLISHAFGHANWPHFIGNFSFILLIGPILEEKYGSVVLIEMIFITAATTGIINTIFFSCGIIGASGIVFMMILLSSFTNMKSREIPLTLVLILLIYFLREILNSFKADNISQFGHIMGGIFGTVFGFFITDKK